MKVHHRCVQSQDHLRETVDKNCTGGYTIEIRHNMYIITTTEPLNQNKIASTSSRDEEDTPTDNCQVAQLLGLGKEAADGIPLNPS